MADKPFSATTRSVLAATGWTVGKLRAHRSEGNRRGVATAYVSTSGEWEVGVPAFPVIGGVRIVVLAQGREDHPALAAMDANEVLWAWRDNRPAPPHLGQRITDAGRATMGEPAA